MEWLRIGSDAGTTGVKVTEEDDLDAFIDPRLKNIDEKLAQLVFRGIKSNVELVTIHLEMLGTFSTQFKKIPQGGHDETACGIPSRTAKPLR